LHDQRKDGERFWNDFHIAPVRDAAGELTHYVSIQSDVTERQHILEQLAYRATFDELTGLPNRQLLFDRLQQGIRNADMQGRGIGVLFVDLDEFKLINDSMGHSAGDEVLRVVGRRFEKAVRSPDTLGRFGGDEFVVILTEQIDEDGVGRVIERISASLAQPIELAGALHYVTASMGYCRYPDAGQDAETLLKKADLAMYQAKQQGRNRAVAYHADFDAGINERLHLVSALSDAMQREEFCLLFQPLFARNGMAVGLEALLRWRHPERGLIMPAQFIGVCEDSGLIVPLGRWVLHEAARHHAQLAAAGLGHLRIAVNVSAAQFQQSLYEDVRGAMEAHALPKGVLELELTESAIMVAPEIAIGIMRRLDALGVSIAVDDFGTGYSSLAYLKRLPIDRLKIDRSFVHDLGRNQDDEAICSSIIQLARSLGLRTIAEGVETAQQMGWLHARGCDEMQGFLLGRPLPFDEALQALLNTNTQRPPDAIA
ncbi:MAG TPA: EAL domain-containing protein, partial [Xanthomonadaceae bacterium]|nr:EAL domain-containing protein [Xanthomonadaceae bacterium]